MYCRPQLSKHLPGVSREFVTPPGPSLFGLVSKGDGSHLDFTLLAGLPPRDGTGGVKTHEWNGDVQQPRACLEGRAPSSPRDLMVTFHRSDLGGRNMLCQPLLASSRQRRARFPFLGPLNTRTWILANVNETTIEGAQTDHLLPFPTLSTPKDQNVGFHTGRQ